MVKVFIVYLSYLILDRLYTLMILIKIKRPSNHVWISWNSRRISCSLRRSAHTRVSGVSATSGSVWVILPCIVVPSQRPSPHSSVWFRINSICCVTLNYGWATAVGVCWIKKGPRRAEKVDAPGCFHMSAQLLEHNASWDFFLDWREVDECSLYQQLHQPSFFWPHSAPMLQS